MNIFYDSNYNSQTSLPNTATFQSLTVNDLIIPNASQGDLLTIDNNKHLIGIDIGPVNYLVQSDGTYPQYTNAININQITATNYKIPGTTHGDLFTVDNANNLERVAIGSAGRILTSTGVNFQWQPLDLPNPLIIQNLTLNSGNLTLNSSNFNTGLINGRLFNRGGIMTSEAAQVYKAPGVGNNLSTVNNVIFSNLINFINGITYKITISATLISSTSTAINLSIAAAPVLSTTENATSAYTRVFSYIAGFTGPGLFNLNAFVSSGNGSLLDYHVFVEPLN